MRTRHEKKKLDSKASEKSLAEDVVVVSVNLHATMIGSVLLLERNHEIQSGIESRVAMVVFALLGVKSCKSCLNLSARKVNGKLRDVLLWCAVTMALRKVHPTVVRGLALQARV